MKITDFSHSSNNNEDRAKTILNSLPEDFQTWCVNKVIAEGDLAPLRSVSNLAELNYLFLAFSRFSPTKSQGVQILELVVELHLMGRQPESAVSKALNANSLLLELKTMRYPMASKQASELQKKSQSLPWPKGLKAQLGRVGDKNGIEVKFFIQTKADLDKYLEKLKDVSQAWGDDV